MYKVDFSKIKFLIFEKILKKVLTFLKRYVIIYLEFKKKGMIFMELDEQFNYLVEYEICTEEEMKLVTSINGYNEESVNDILYVRTGYRDMEQYLEYEDKETYNEYYNKEEE